MMPPSIHVCPVELPGRGRREQESSISSIAEIAQTLAHALPLEVRSSSNQHWSMYIHTFQYLSCIACKNTKQAL